MMKSLVEVCTDNATYSYENLLLVINDDVLLTHRFKEHFMAMFPETSDIDYLKLIVDNEEIEVRNDCGDKFIVRIENVIYFE